ncbi:CBO0543 family protein [Metabacillus idriensis]|uniref:CBO0543 family protein n=1 Tax=Metabacillus idriensis TaxID=324768 RepID=UPI003D28A84C
MNIERWIIAGAIVLCILLIWKFVPKEKAREAWVPFLSMSSLTWAAGLFVVQKGWIYYPVQLLSKENQVNESSFTFEFFLFPVLAILFSLHYPSSKKIQSKWLYAIVFSGVFTIAEVILEKYTNAVEYDEWKWYWTFFSVMLALMMNHQYVIWFKKGLKPAGENHA